MKNMEREKFEESLKKAFDKAEVGPSDGVWTNIELELEKAKGGHLKKRLMFYQALAAASVIFAMAIGGIGYYYNMSQGQSSANRLAVEATPSSDVLSSETTPAKTENNADDPNADGAVDEEPEKKSTNNDNRDNNVAALPPQARIDHIGGFSAREVQPSGNPDDSGTVSGNEAGAALLATNNEAQLLQELPNGIEERDLAPLYVPREIQLNFQLQDEAVDPVVAMLATLEQREQEIQGERKNKKEAAGTNENLWTSIGFAAGAFNSVQSASSASAPAFNTATAMALAAPTVEKETKASGYSYTMGVNVGTRLSKRWVFQGGVNFLTHASEYTANNVVAEPTNSYQQQRFRAISTNELIRANEQELTNKIVYSAPYNVNNNMRYLSIPMQAGYLLVNKTVGLQLNAGVATDLFLQNTIKADSDQLDKTSQPGGSDSPYRSVNLSGLLGTEVSYRFGENYRISLNPGIRYPFNTIYKSELGVQSTPLTFDVGLRFRYIFH